MSNILINCTMRRDYPALRLEKGDIVKVRGTVYKDQVQEVPPKNVSDSPKVIVILNNRPFNITKSYVVLPGDKDYTS